jgi:hypothetical protein
MLSDLKLSFRWLGPYKVREANILKGTYILKEFNSTWLKGIYIGNCLKKFVYKKNAFILANIDDDIDSTISSLLK